MNRIPKAVYTSEFREQAVKLALSECVGISEAARRLSVPLKTLANWVRSAKAGKLQEIGKEQKPQTELEAELSRVQRELAEVKMERETPAILDLHSAQAPVPASGPGSPVQYASACARTPRVAPAQCRPAGW